MDNSIDTLRSNLMELHHSVRHPQQGFLPLVANGSGTRIYDSRFAWGRFWTFLYSIGSWLTGHDFRLEKLKQAAIHTHNLFHTLQQSSNAAVTLYRNYLDRVSKGYLADERNVFGARIAIIQWKGATRPFLNTLQTPAAARLRKLFEHAIGQVDNKPPFTDAIRPQLDHCRHVIVLEGLLGGPLPLVILKKVLKGKSLNPLETKELSRYATKLNHCHITPNQLHKAIASLAQLLQGDEDKIPDSETARLEQALEQNGCVLFKQDDPKQIIWRDHLRPGTVITCGDKSYTLSHEIHPEIDGSDDTRAYTLKDCPDHVAIVAKNKIILRLRQYASPSEPLFGISPAKIEALTADGAAAIMEKLTPLNPIDHANIISDLVKNMVKAEQTPLNFSPSAVMLDAEGRLISIKPLKTGPFNFNALEDFVIKCSDGNEDVFKRLMLDSGLLKHPAARFYDDYLTSILNNESIAVEDLAGIYKIADSDVIDRAHSLGVKLKEMKTSIYTVIRRRNLQETPARLSTRINEAILFCKKDSCMAGTLWPSFESAVLAQCANGRLAAGLS